jgi:hypothetical protein
MSLIIEWIPASKEAELVVPCPKPARMYIPQWYKDVEVMKSPIFSDDGEIINKNIKNCMPFLDAMTHGYIQESWTDIYIESHGDSVKYYYPVGPEILGHREPNSGFSYGQLFYPIEFVWKEQWVPKLPNGYSVLYTSPLNNFDLPFRSLDAVIDSDQYYHEHKGQYPFYMYKGFSGVIPAGTPLFQIIPIKRSSWKSSSQPFNKDFNFISQNNIRKKLFNSYKKQFWQRKVFD